MHYLCISCSDWTVTAFLSYYDAVNVFDVLYEHDNLLLVMDQ